MASSAIRLRRALSFSSALAARSTTSPSPISTVHRSPLLRIPFSSPPPTANSLPQFSSRYLHSTSLSLSSSRQFNHGDDQIDENTILFEGCDYKHWLITMDFPKDPRPTPEEMVETYVQTLAKVVGSVEEAKKRMYACSTTTYQGFQAEMDEETSQKFEGMPGVVFVLPDSYIDPVNKEYGGDKYINGTIIPRPPPVQYGRQRRQRDDQQRNSGYNRQQNDGTRPNFPSQQNYGAPQGSPQRGPMQNYPPQQNYAHSQNLPPQQNYASRQSYPPQQNYGSPRQGDRMDTMPPHNQGSYNQGSGDPLRNQRDYGHSQNFVPPSSSGAQYGQGDRGSYGQGDRGSYGQGDRGSYGQNQTAPPSFSRAQYGQGDRGSYGQNQTGQFGNGGSYGQGNNGQNQTGQYGNGTGMPYGQGNVSGYQQGYPAHEQNRQFNHPNGDQSTTGQKQQNFPSTGLPGRD